MHLVPEKDVPGHFNVLRGYVRPLGLAGVKVVGDYYRNYEVGLPSELAVLNLFRRSNRIIFRYEIKEGPKVYEATLRGKKITLYNDTAIAYGQDGKEIFRTTVEEPLHVRPPAHANSI